MDDPVSDSHPSRGRALQVRAPAKINLFLEVRGRREDGYHELNSLMVPVSWFDHVTVELAGEAGRVEVECQGAGGVPGGEGNLCHRAARFYFRRSGAPGGARIRVQKRVPVGAGLGGGSSDAAATVMALERLTGRPLSPEDRRRAAFEVGADVPFFFARGPAWVEGIGERVRAGFPLPPLWLVVIHPGVFLATGRVFSGLDRGLTTPGRPHTIAQFNFQGLVEGLRNDLQAAAVVMEPAVARALEALVRAGAPSSLMSGSGSAVFGVFPTRDAAEAVAASVGGQPEAEEWRIEVVHSLPAGAFPFSTEPNSDWGVDKR